MKSGSQDVTSGVEAFYRCGHDNDHGPVMQAVAVISDSSSVSAGCLMFDLDVIKVRETIMDTRVARASSTLARLAGVLLVIVCMGFFAPQRAQAEALNLVTCTGTHTTNWSPGLTNTSQTIVVSTTSNWSPCVSLSFPLVTSASSSESFQSTFSCQSLLLPTSSRTWVISWSDGVTSTYTFNATINNIGTLNTTIVGVGAIVDGRYKGANATSTFLLGNLQSTLNDSCDTATGVTSVSGLSTLVITP